MVSVTQQMLQQQRKERAIASAQQRQSVPTPTWQEYDQSTTEGQVLSTRQQIQQARTPLEQFKREQLYPKQRQRAFTARKDRAALVQTGRQVEAQLGEVAGQEQTFEREVATKAPEYATQVYKQQAIQEARSAIQSRVNDLNARIKDRQLQIQRYEERERNERGYDAGDTIDDLKNDIDEYRAELREYQKGLGYDENTLIKQHFSGYLQQKADYESNYARQRNRQQADFRKYKQTEDFKKLAADLKLPANASLSQFEQSVSKFNQDVAYKNQLLKFADQKGGVQFLNPEQQKALGIDTQGFDYYKTPQKGWVDPNTGRLIEMSIKEDYAKNMGYLPVEVQAFNRKTGEYISSSQSSLLTQQQKRMYDLFQESPKAASVFGFNINQSTKLPTEFVLKGSTQPMEYQKQIPSFLKKPSASGGAYEAATRMSPFTEEDLKRIDEFNKYGKYGISSIGSPGLLGDVAISKSVGNNSNISLSNPVMVVNSAEKELSWLQRFKNAFDIKTYSDKYNKPALEIYNNPNLTNEEKYQKLITLGKKQNQEIINSDEFKIRLGSFLALSGGVAGLSTSTVAALSLNAGNFAKILNPVSSNETKVASLKQIALSLGTAYLSSAALGAVAGFTKDAAQVTGYRILAGVLSKAGSTGSAVARNIAGLSLVGAGKAAQFGIETYFKKQMIETAITFAQSARQKDYEKASLSAAEFIGGYGIPGTRVKGGFAAGMKVGSKVFSLGGLLTGKLVSARPELYKGQVTIKRSPSAIQTDILTGGKPVIGYRLGPVETGLKYTPRLDKYLSTKIKDPTKGTFLRYEETIGVKGKRIQPALSTPAFVQPPRYRDMFLSNYKAATGSKFKKIIDAFAQTPVMTDVLGVMKVQTKINPKYEVLRNQAIKEYATTGKLSAYTKKALLKADLKISDKLRELEFAEEQELVLRKMDKLKNVQFGFTRGADGRVIPVLYEKGTLKPSLSVLKQKKIITEQDAKFIQRQYNMWQKFGKDYVLPKEHSVRHSKEVMENVKKVVNAYPEYHPYLKKKYGSLDKAIKELQKGAKFHDIGKTSETSAEFGTPHGQKFYDVYKAKLLPKEAQNIKEGIARAIKTHETIAGTKAGRYTLKYQLSNILGLNTPEQKILATADRLDLMRYASLRDKVDPKRLPLGDALTRLGFRAPPVKRESITGKLVSFVSSAIPAKQKIKALEKVSYYNPLVGSQMPRYAPTKKEQPQYNPLVPSKTYSYRSPKQQYGAPYKKIDSYFRPIDYKTPYKKPTRYDKPGYQKSDYKPKRYEQPLYSQPKYPKPTTYKAPYSPPRPAPQPTANLLIAPKPGKPRPQPRQQIRRPINSLMTPTITQKIFRVRRKGGKLKRATGFEWARF